MAHDELRNTDPEDISDLLVKIEKSFRIKFDSSEFTDISSFGNLCDLVIDKIELREADGCTKQQAFHKFRDAVVSVLQVERSRVVPELKLAELLPAKGRRSNVRELEKCIGFSLRLLRQNYYVDLVFLAMSLASIVGCFIYTPIVIGLVIAIIGFWLNRKFGKVLDLTTVGDVVERMTRENYSKSRRDKGSFNRMEIEKLLKDWFSDELVLNKNKLTRHTEWV